jgi:hypothetical protein
MMLTLNTLVTLLVSYPKYMNVALFVELFLFSFCFMDSVNWYLFYCIVLYSFMYPSRSFPWGDVTAPLPGASD